MQSSSCAPQRKADRGLFHGRFGQDQWFAEFLRAPNGYFVEIGAGEGLEGSNSLWFESAGWSGLCIEQCEELFSQLSKNRMCAVSSVRLGGGDGNGQVRSLESVMDEVSAPDVIDYLSISAGASVSNILAGLGWKTRLARAIGVEHGGSDDLAKRIEGILNPRGYVLCGLSEREDYYLLFPDRDKCPMTPRLDLFAEYHRFGNDVRDAEIEGALRDNLNLEFVRKLYLLNGTDAPESIVDHPKCEIVPLPRRLNMQEIIAFADRAAGTWCRLLINSDIVLDENCFRLPLLIGSGEIFVLRRLEADGRLNSRAGLDAWCWADRCRITGAEFEMGRVHCDLRMNQLAWEAYGTGLSCPSLTFSAHHRHASEIRPGTSNRAAGIQVAVKGARRNITATAHPFQIGVEVTTP